MAKFGDTIRTFGRLEQLASGDSSIHRLHPMVKVALTFIYIVTVVSFPGDSVSGLIPMLVFPVILMSLSGTPYDPLVRRVLIALPFAAAAGLGNVFLNRETALYLGSIPVTYGALSFASLTLKTMLTVAAVLILTATTPLDKIIACLTQIHIPKIICIQIMLTYRYIAVLLGETSRAYNAYSLRSAERGGVCMRDIGSFLGQILLRSFDRSERVYGAMKCRGFSGDFPTGDADPPTIRDISFAALTALVIVIPRIYNFSLIIGKSLG